MRIEIGCNCCGSGKCGPRHRDEPHDRRYEHERHESEPSNLRRIPPPGAIRRSLPGGPAHPRPEHGQSSPVRPMASTLPGLVRMDEPLQTPGMSWRPGPGHPRPKETSPVRPMTSNAKGPCQDGPPRGAGLRRSTKDNQAGGPLCRFEDAWERIARSRSSGRGCFERLAVGYQRRDFDVFEAACRPDMVVTLAGSSQLARYLPG